MLLIWKHFNIILEVLSEYCFKARKFWNSLVSYEMVSCNRMLDRKSNWRNYAQSCSFLDRLLGGRGHYLCRVFFLHLDHLLIYYVLPKFILKKIYIVYTCFVMAFILQLQCFKSTNSDECFDQTALCIPCSQAYSFTPPWSHSKHALQLPGVEASSTEHSLFFFFPNDWYFTFP